MRTLLLASKAGHHFDFFTDEIKAVLLAGALGVRLYRAGGFGPALHLPFVERWPAESPIFLFAATAGSIILASAISLTNFVRDTMVDAAKLPMRLTAHTPCFRSEAGSY